MGVLAILPWRRRGPKNGRQKAMVGSKTKHQKKKMAFQNGDEEDCEMGRSKSKNTSDISEEDLKLLPINLSKSPSTQV